MSELQLSLHAGAPATIHRLCIRAAQQQQASSATGLGSPVCPQQVHACRSTVQAAARPAPSSSRPPQVVRASLPQQTVQHRNTAAASYSKTGAGQPRSPVWLPRQGCPQLAADRLPLPASVWPPPADSPPLPLPHQWSRAHLGALCAGDQRLAHIAGVEHRRGLHVIPVLPGEGVHTAAKEGVRGLLTRQQGSQPLIPTCSAHRGQDNFPQAEKSSWMQRETLLPSCWPLSSGRFPRRHTWGRQPACIPGLHRACMAQPRALTVKACSAATATAGWQKTCCSSCWRLVASRQPWLMECMLSSNCLCMCHADRHRKCSIGCLVAATACWRSHSCFSSMQL